jgi:predicted phage terminase large subunit-like protein
MSEYSKFLAEKKTVQADDLLWLRCATDVELFADSFFPHFCQLPFNELHHDLFYNIRFMERSVRRARAAPRGYAKSTVAALIKPIHDVAYGLETFIVIISNTQTQADQKLSDIRTEILTNTHLSEFYNLRFRMRKPGSTRFTIYGQGHHTLFQSYGSGAEIRGIRDGANRPSKIVADDMEHSTEVENEDLRQKYFDWFFQVVSKIGNKETNIEVVGTILHDESLLKGLTKNAAYDSKIYRAIISWSTRQDLWNQWTKIYCDLDNTSRKSDANRFYLENATAMLEGTKVLWEEHETYLDLMKELIESGRRAFMKEKQNEPLGATDALFETFHWYHEVTDGFFIEKPGHKDGGVLIPWSELKDRDGHWLNAFGALDPATGQTKAKAGKSGDYSAILTGLKHLRTGRLFVHADWLKRASPTKFIREIFELEELYGYQKFAVETNLYRDLLIPNMNEERKRREQETKKTIKVPFYDVVNIAKKEERIYTLEPKVTHGHILFNRGLSETFRRQMDQFPKGDHDDGPDCLEMLYGVVHNRYKASSMAKDVQGSR